MQTVDKCQLLGCSQAQSIDSAEQSLACLCKRHALLIPACARARHGWGTPGFVPGRGGDMVSSAIHPALVPKQDHPCWPAQRGRMQPIPQACRRTRAHMCPHGCMLSRSILCPVISSQRVLSVFTRIWSLKYHGMAC